MSNSYFCELSVDQQFVNLFQFSIDKSFCLMGLDGGFWEIVDFICPSVSVFAIHHANQLVQFFSNISRHGLQTGRWILWCGIFLLPGSPPVCVRDGERSSVRRSRSRSVATPGTQARTMVGILPGMVVELVREVKVRRRVLVLTFSQNGIPEWIFPVNGRVA